MVVCLQVVVVLAAVISPILFPRWQGLVSWATAIVTAVARWASVARDHLMYLQRHISLVQQQLMRLEGFQMQALSPGQYFSLEEINIIRKASQQCRNLLIKMKKREQVMCK